MNETVESQTKTQIEANSNMMRSRAENDMGSSAKHKLVLGGNVENVG